VGPEIELVRLEAQDSKLSELSEARRLVKTAQEILQRDLRIAEEEAFLVLQRESRDRRKSMKEIAEAILIADEIVSRRNPPRPS
jgi:uroporphyrinogen-III synthase